MKRKILSFIIISISLLTTRVYSENQNKIYWQDEVFYHIFPRSFYDSNGDGHGDFNGIALKLDYLQNLGVTVIWLNPIFLSELYHNYFADNFLKVDNEFGTLDDFRVLCKKIHKRNMKIFIDMETVYITGKHKWYVDSYKNPKSKYSEYIKYNGKNNTAPESIIWNLKNIPTYNNKNIQVMTLNLKNKKLLEEQKKIYSFWIDPNGDGNFNDGVDGYRMDHIMDNLDNKGQFTNLLEKFWKPIVEHVKSIKPGCFFIVEQAQWSTYGYEILEKANMDASFNIPFRFTLVSSFKKFNKTSFIKALLRYNKNLPENKYIVNIIENHDVTRFATECDSNDNKLKLGAVINLTLKGIPCIYYGQELGMKGSKISIANDGADIPVRDAFRWNKSITNKGTALWYKKTGQWMKILNPKSNTGISVEEQSFNKDSLLNTYKKIIKFRSESLALKRGDMEIIANENKNLISFARIYLDKKDYKRVIVVINFSNTVQTALLDFSNIIKSGRTFYLKDILLEKKERDLNFSNRAKYKVTLKPYQSKIITVK